MRILFWCDAFWPLIGGVEVLAARLVRTLRERGHELCVITRREPNHNAFDMFGETPVHRLEFLEVRTSRDIHQWTAMRTQVSRIKREFRPDIVHVYHPSIDTLFHLITAAAHPAPTLCTVHGHLHEHDLIVDSVVERLLRTADWVATCSVATLDETRRHFPALVTRSSVVRNGLDAPDVRPAPLSFDPPTLLCLGRIGTVDEKGFDLAIEAMLHLRRKYPRLRLQIAGDGAARRDLEQVARDFGVDDVVSFCGFVHPDRVPTLLDAATILLMPSRVAEGFGLVALQAAQMERPVVASCIGGVPEVVHDGVTGVLAEPNDSRALAACIASLLDNPSRAIAMGKAGRQRALAEFTLTAYVDGYEALLQQLVTAPFRTAAMHSANTMKQ